MNLTFQEPTQHYSISSSHPQKLGPNFAVYVESAQVLKFFMKAEGSRPLEGGIYRWPYMDIAVALRTGPGDEFVVINRTHPTTLLDQLDRVDFDGVDVWAVR